MHGPTDEHLLERLLSDNDELAGHNREHFEEMGVFAVNLMSAPGAGKTTLLSAAGRELRQSYRLSVIEGDMVGDLDVQRLAAEGLSAFQITTGRACHLDAQMIARFLHEDKLPPSDLVFLENVGNLVCPAEFPLGEHLRVVLLSVTEGDDKPLKYPVIFHKCDAVIFSKCDLLPYVQFDLGQAKNYLRGLNPHLQTFEVSAKTGQGIKPWTDWLKDKLSRHQSTLKLAGAGK